MTVWLMLAVFFFIANLPWMGSRVFFIFPMKSKPLWIRFLELLAYYFLSLLVGALFETEFSGNIYQQEWEFFVITLSLFLVLSAPGVIYRYQWLPMQKKYR